MAPEFYNHLFIFFTTLANDDLLSQFPCIQTKDSRSEILRALVFRPSCGAKPSFYEGQKP